MRERERETSFDVATDIAEDERIERVLLHGRDLVVFGKGFKSGAVRDLTLEQFNDPSDVVDLSARDITDDGKAEIFVRGVMRSKAPRRFGDRAVRTVVGREVLLVYSVGPRGISRVFGAETGREIAGESACKARSRSSPVRRGSISRCAPGRHSGFTDRTYPFAQDREKVGGLEPFALERRCADALPLGRDAVRPLELRTGRPEVPCGGRRTRVRSAIAAHRRDGRRLSLRRASRADSRCRATERRRLARIAWPRSLRRRPPQGTSGRPM